MTTKYYRDSDGVYLGGYSEGNSEIPNGAIEVATPPDNAQYIWVNNAWVEPVGLIEDMGADGFDSGQLPITAGGEYTIAHELGGKPLSIQIILTCIEENEGYAVGDALYFYPQANSGDDGIIVIANTEEIFIKFGKSGFCIDILNKETATARGLNPTKWNFQILVKR